MGLEGKIEKYAPDVSAESGERVKLPQKRRVVEGWFASPSNERAKVARADESLIKVERGGESRAEQSRAEDQKGQRKESVEHFRSFNRGGTFSAWIL